MKQTTPFPFQTEDVKRIQRDFGGRCLLANPTGTGKSYTSLLWAWKCLPDDPPGPIVVVCPSHLKLNWKREAYKHLGVHVTVLSGQTVPPRHPSPQDPNQVLVVNYQILVPPLWSPRTALPSNSWAGYLANLHPRLVIGDEAQALSNHESKQTRAFRKLTQTVPHVLLLTATPLSNNVLGVWSLCRILRPELFPSRFDFASQYTHARHRWWGWEFRGARNLDSLHKILVNNCMIRRRKEDILDQLPPVLHTVIPIEVDLHEYHRVENDFLGWLDTQTPGASSFVMHSQELAKIGHLRRLAARLKVDTMIEWIRDILEEGGKLLLGALHYEITERLLAAFKNEAVLVDGRMNSREKDNAFLRFNRLAACRVLIGNIEAAGTGWNCTATSDLALCELPWRPGDVSQFIGRVEGIERGLPGASAHIRYLVARGTIEEDICAILQKKANWAAQAIDGVNDNNGLDIFHQVIQLMRKRHRGER